MSGNMIGLACPEAWWGKVRGRKAAGFGLTGKRKWNRARRFYKSPSIATEDAEHQGSQLIRVNEVVELMQLQLAVAAASAGTASMQQPCGQTCRMSLKQSGNASSLCYAIVILPVTTRILFELGHIDAVLTQCCPPYACILIQYLLLEP